MQPRAAHLFETTCKVVQDSVRILLTAGRQPPGSMSRHVRCCVRLPFTTECKYRLRSGIPSPLHPPPKNNQENHAKKHETVPRVASRSESERQLHATHRQHARVCQKQADHARRRVVRSRGQQGLAWSRCGAEAPVAACELVPVKAVFDGSRVGAPRAACRTPLPSMEPGTRQRESRKRHAPARRPIKTAGRAHHLLCRSCRTSALARGPCSWSYRHSQPSASS